MTRLTGAQAIVRCLEREGIDMVFGIPGNQSMPIFDALYHHPTIRHMVVRHEQAAAFMADGYARASGRAAAVLSLPGPGVTNAYTGLAEAFTDSTPVLLLAAQVEREFINQDRGTLHELTHQYEVLNPIMKHGEKILAPTEISAAFRRAGAALRSGRPRPVQIEIPRDVQMEVFEWPDDTEMMPSGAGQPLCAPADAMEAAVQALAGAQHPLIIAGGGVISSGASCILTRLAERLGAPVLTTGMGVGSIPGDHPLACGVAWMASADIRPLLAACDALLAVGTRFNQAMTHNWSIELPPVTIRIDVDPEEIERNLPMNHKLLGDAAETLAVIEQRLAELKVDRQAQLPLVLAAAREDFRAALMRRLGSTLPWMLALRASLPNDAIISADMSLFWADMLGIFPVYEPRTMMFPWGYGTLGFSLPEALGAKVAQPHQPVIAIAGDGAFLYTGTELATAVQYGLNLPILIPNNNAYGMIKALQRDLWDERFISVDLTNPDFVRFAHAFGAYGVRVTTPDDMKAEIRKALVADKPTVIEIPWEWTWGNDRST